MISQKLSNDPLNEVSSNSASLYVLSVCSIPICKQVSFVSTLTVKRDAFFYDNFA